MADAFEGAKLVGYSTDSLTICIWYGGCGFTVYDSESWEEIHYFTVGHGVLATGEASDAVMKDSAIKQMKKRDFEVVQ
jgi:hypothetical protein